MKKRTWAEITARINEIGECRREVIEVVKKWSDLKCDTKRKVDAMQAGLAPSRSLSSRFSRDLNQTEKVVHSILEMKEEDHSTGDFGPLEDEDDLLEEEEEEVEEKDGIGLQSLTNGTLYTACTSPQESDFRQWITYLHSFTVNRIYWLNKNNIGLLSKSQSNQGNRIVTFNHCTQCVSVERCLFMCSVKHLKQKVHFPHVGLSSDDRKKQQQANKFWPGNLYLN